MKSTKFVTACYIMSFVGAHQPQMLSTATVAKWVDTHAARARQIVSLLVKAGLLESARGGSGGILLKRSADRITLLDIYDAVGDTESLFFSVDNPFSAWADHCSVHDVLSGLRAELEEQARAALAKIKLSDVFVPWDEDAMRKARSKRSRKAATV
ncbi:Rrf2 family transcriptional regulator [Burkholderia multivorans]|uniref:RrF2 family transcriptional regulator n=1 Tax=Burkholderia multivorans TaxID=87883 RepID=UPI000CFFB3F0|nr:Rrf2 family transcriptional regulator [Burkholderia multivorans]MBJ9618437.1 Rrf2 family transcriptional regulator [Burkholderia multivorans]MBJ9624680.1 Rrf2 family transcriptional regulator [Burkholderia multivorans]MBU9163863.1 Rrf2 family transcriptional regulator [Burkholderia multivorans]MBU9329424.1 Rrf2 family transcriptional regulator [Burkholderia multivorans]MBU9491527.1 Rrf2 family transcriptional regulator [Burkholderia multivorans]